mgnify:FL=1|tara:strand:- start:202 stop:2550 length:2349 start_codon:yes stop_codon:yes gene_type:complete
MAENTKPSNVDRSLLQAPSELEPEINIEEPPIDIEVEETPTEDEGAEVIFGEGDSTTIGEEPEDFYDNLVEQLDSQTIDELYNMVTSSVDEDKTSREEWEEAYTKGLELLGLRYENRTEPFDGATGVIHPLLNEAVTQFQAGAYKEMLPSTGPVRANIIGEPSPQIEQQASRVQEYMNYQIMYNMEEYEPEFDQMLYYLGLAGSAFKKVYRDDILNRPVSKFVPAEDIIVPYTAVDLKTAERVTHVMKMSTNELKKLQLKGLYRNVDINPPSTPEQDQISEAYEKLEGVSPSNETEEVVLYECHCYLDLKEYPDVDQNNSETGIKLPYVVTVTENNSQVLSVRRNYRKNDVNKEKIPHFVQYKFTPGLGFYGFGLVHLLSNLSRTATANLRQLIDAGTLSNMPAGFKARGLRIADDQNPLAPGEFRDVDVPGGDLKASLMPLPYKEPSATLFQLMGFVVGAAEKFIGTTDIGIGDGNKEMPVGTTIALLERGARVISAVHKRLHASMKNELRLLATLFGEDPTPYPYEVGADKQIKIQDFDGRIDILPVSDPNIFSMSQRVVLAQEQMKLATAAPDLHDMYEAYRRVYQALGVDNIDSILKPQPISMPMDPATENQMASSVAKGQGMLKAFPEQDHDAHIAVHLAYMNSKVAQMQPAVLLVLEKHIYEHIGLKAQVMVMQNPQNAQLPPEQMQNLIAQTQAQLIAEFQQQNPPQPQTDPLVAIKQQEVNLKAQELQQENQYDQQKLQLDTQKAQSNEQLQRDRLQSTEQIANARLNAQTQKD